MTKSYKILLVINICALGVLFAVWWTNGRDDTWLYITSAMIVLTSFLYIKPTMNDSSQ